MTASAPASASRWQITGLIMGLCLISQFNRAAMSVAGTDQIIDNFGVTPTQMGTVYSAFLIVYSVCMIPGGVFIDRFGPRRALMVVGFGSAVFCALTGVAGWVFASSTSLLIGLILIRGTMGLVSAPLHPAGARAIGNWFPFTHRSRANGFVTAAAIGGVALSYPGFGLLIRNFGWQAAFVICAGLTALLTLVWSYRATDAPAERPNTGATTPPIDTDGATKTHTSPSIGWLGLLTNRSLILLTLSYGAVGYFQYLFVYWTEYYLKTVLGVDPTTSKYYASAPQVALALGMPLGGWLSELLSGRWGARWGRAIVAGGGMLLSASLVGVGLLAREPAWIVAWLALAHFALGTAEGPIWATAVDIGVSKGGTAAAICNTGGNVGGLIAPMMTPWIGALFGWPWAIALGGVICLLGAICWVRIDPGPERGGG